MNGRHRAATGPRFLRAGALRNLQSFLEIRVPHRRRILVVAVHDAAERQAELVLVGGELDAVVHVRQFFAERI